MGCGDVCETGCLFGCDVQSSNTGRYARHAQEYADLAAREAELQAERVAAFRSFSADVASGSYPEPRHQVRMDPEEYETFTRRAQNL